APAGEPVPSLGDPRFADEREALKAIVQHPDIAAPFAAELDDNDFTHPWTKELWQHISAKPFPTSIDPVWASSIADSLPSDQVRRVFTQCVVEPLRAQTSVTTNLIESLIARLQEVTTARRVVEVKSKLQRTNPVDQAEEYNRMFGELVALEQQRRSLRERAIGQSAY
ncbi:MAG: DNA primase, partial [Propionibacteriales bacterium]|nr:DNA primase [Propionibacteriales bacterium]